MHALRSRAALFGLLLGCFFLCLYLLSGSSDLKHNGDTDLRYQTTQAMVDYHRLWIADPLWHDSRVAPGRGGHLYAFYAPGQPVLMIPLYIAGKALAHHLSLPYDITTLYVARSLDLWLGAALAVVFYLLALATGYPLRVATALTLLFGTATVVWPDAQSALEQTQVNLFLLVAVLGMVQYRNTRLDRWLALAGTGLGLAVFTRYDALLFIPIVAMYLVFLQPRLRPRRTWLVFAGSIAPWGLAVAAWNWARFGSPFLTGLHEQTWGEPMLQGLAGLLVSPGKGLIWYLPLVFALPWAVPRFCRRAPDLAVLFGALFVVPLLFYANVLYWHGDPAWGPRYLYAGVPYLILPLGEILVCWRRTSHLGRAGFALLVLAGILLSVAAVSVTQWRFWYRLQAMQQSTVDARTWSGQPFRWGSTHYHYYWNLRESPIVIQLDDVYQVARLHLGAEQYRYLTKPDPLVASNTALNYPINEFAFWWLDPMHPLLGTKTRDVIAAGLGGGAALSLVLLLIGLRRPAPARRPAVRVALEAG